MNKVLNFDANHVRTLPRCNPTMGHHSAEVILIVPPDQKGYGYAKSKIDKATGGGYASR